MRARLTEILEESVEISSKVVESSFLYENKIEEDINKFLNENTTVLNRFSNFENHKDMVQFLPSLQETDIDLQDFKIFVDKIIADSPLSLHLDLGIVDFTSEHFSLLTLLFKANIYELHITMPQCNPSNKEAYALFFKNCMSLDSISPIKILNLHLAETVNRISPLVREHILNSICELIISPKRPSFLRLDFFRCFMEVRDVECLCNALTISQLKTIALQFEYNVNAFPNCLNEESLAKLTTAFSRNRNVTICNIVDMVGAPLNHPLYQKINHCTDRNRLLNTYPQYSAIIKQAYAEIGLNLPVECDSLKNIAGKFTLFNKVRGNLEDLPSELKEHLAMIKLFNQITHLEEDTQISPTSSSPS